LRVVHIHDLLYSVSSCVVGSAAPTVHLVGGTAEDILLRSESALRLYLRLSTIYLIFLQWFCNIVTGIGLRIWVLPLLIAFEAISSATHDYLLTHGHLILLSLFNWNSGLAPKWIRVLGCSNLLCLSKALFDRLITGDCASLFPNDPIIIIVIIESRSLD
jgi:hypothetical protein